MKNWKTTVCGIVAASAAGVAATYMASDPMIAKIAGVIAAIATGAMGILAKDRNVTGGNVRL